MNAETEAEKAAINKELKMYYEGLSDEDKAAFNDELQTFLIKEYANMKAVHDAVKGGGPSAN